MKVAIIFSEGIKQINFTPENNDEKQALKLITPNDEIQLAVKNGNFGEDRYEPFVIEINECKGGYLRAFDSSESIMLVLSPKPKINEFVVTAEHSVTANQAAIEFANSELSKVDSLLSDDYKIGFKEGVENYIMKVLTINK